MPVTVDKLLGKPLLHTHQLGDIIVGTTGSVNVANVVTTATNKNADVETIILVDATSGAITITLPPALSYLNKIYTIKKIDSTTNSVIVDGNGAETIDNNQTVTIGFQYTTLQIVSNGIAWYII